MALTAPGTWDPKTFSISIAGQPIIGFADGTFLEVKRAGPAYIKTVGADGEVARSRMADKSGEITITLIQTSISNDFLSALANRDEESGTGLGPFLAKDHKSLTMIVGGNCWVRQLPDASFGKELNDRVWIFDVDVLTMIIGGEPRLV